MATLKRTLEDIKKQYGRKAARAFDDAISNVKSDVVLNRFIAAIERGDIQGAMDVLNIDETVFASLRAQVTAAYSEAGAAVIAATRFDPPNQKTAVVRWDVTNPVAEKYLRNVLGVETTDITNKTLEGVRVKLQEGYAKGQGPRQIALDIVGRVGANGKRTGGVVGLTGPQTQWVNNMRTYLQEGNYQKALRMSRRDKRFDRTILKAIREERPLTTSQISKMTARYSDRLLKLRGDTIGRTETAQAVEQARFDGLRVGMEKKGYPLHYAKKEWLHGGGGMQPRDQHVAISRTVVDGLYTPFVMADGTQMMHPLDPNAPAEQVINCTCTAVMGVDFVRLKRDGLV